MIPFRDGASVCMVWHLAVLGYVSSGSSEKREGFSGSSIRVGLH
jgi:hypothetical protein